MSKRAETTAMNTYPRSDFQSVETSRKTKRKCFISGYEQAEKDLIPLVQLWVDSGDANVVSFRQFLECHETQSNK